MRGSKVVPEQTARVTLKRLAWPFGDVFRTYSVLIDGTVVGGIRRRQTKTFDVPPGRHQIQLKIDFCSSPDVALDLAPGEEVQLTCKARSFNAGSAMIRGFGNYIVLDVVGSPTGPH